MSLANSVFTATCTQEREGVCVCVGGGGGGGGVLCKGRKLNACIPEIRSREALLHLCMVTLAP